MVGSALIIGCLWLAQVSESGTMAPVRPQAARLQRLIRQLNDDRLATRQAAEQQLIDIGPTILDQLPAANATVPPEVKERLGRVRQELEVQQASQRVQASRVSLTGEMDSAQAFQVIQQQTGNQLVGYAQQSKQVDLMFEETPFWPAVDQLMDQCDLTSGLFGMEGRAIALQIRPSGLRPRFGHAAYYGIFRIEATQVSTVQDLLRPENATMRVRLAVAWEPRITPISLSLPMKAIQATDDRGNQISVPNRRGKLSATVRDDFYQVEIDLPLGLPDRGSRQIRSLRGQLVALLPGGVERFEFDAEKESEQLTQQRAGVTVTLKRIIKNGDLFTFDMRVRFDDADDALASHRGWFFRNAAYLKDDTGKRIEHDGLERTFQSRDEIGIAYRFMLDELPGNGQFVYETPTLLINSEIPFELQGIDLP